MAEITTGKLRSITLRITKKINGNLVGGYPHTYNGKNQFIWDNITYPEITSYQFGRLNDENYTIRLEAFKLYVQSIENGLDIVEDIDPNAPPYKPGTIDDGCTVTGSQCTTNFYVSKMNFAASGYILNGGVGSQNYLISGTEFTNISITGVSTNGSTIIGWSDEPSGSNIISTNAILNIPLGCGSKFYLILSNDLIIAKTFYYYSADATIEEICGTCSKIVTVYFNKLQAQNGIDKNNTVWYSNMGLTKKVNGGYYKLSNIPNGTIYMISMGKVIGSKICSDGDILPCCV